MLLSELHGRPLYSDKGATYVGKVEDVIVDVENGHITKLTTERVSTAMPRAKAEEIIHEKGIDYKNVKEVGDIIIIESL